MYKTVFKTLEEIQAHDPSLNDLNIKAIQPSVGRVLDNEIIPLIGEGIALPLIEKYTLGEVELTDPEKALLFHIQAAAIHLAWYYYLPRHRIQLRQAGAFVGSAGDMKLPSDRKNDKMDIYFAETGLNCIDTLLAFLEKNSADYTVGAVEWKNLPEFAASKELFISNAKMLTVYVSAVRNSRRTYMALRSIMARVQEDEIAGELGATKYTELLAKWQTADPEWTEEEEAILRLVKQALAYRTWEIAIDEMALQVTPDGVVVFNNQMSRDVDSKMPATDGMLRPSRDNYRRLADSRFTKLVELLAGGGDEPIRTAPDNTDEDSKIFWL